MIKGLHVTGDHQGSTSSVGFNDVDAPVIAASCDAVMIPVVWPDIQPTATSLYSETILRVYDGRIRLARSLGLKVVLGIGQVPSWAAGTNCGPKDLSFNGPWIQWVRAIATRYAGLVAAILPENETNFGWRDDPRGAATVSAELAQCASLVLATIPRAPKLWVPAALDINGSLSFMDKFLSLTQGSIYGVAYHPYKMQPAEMVALFELLERHHRQSVVHVTEVGALQPTLLVNGAYQLAPTANLEAALDLERNFYNWCGAYAHGTRSIGSFFHYQNRLSRSVRWFTSCHGYDDALTPVGAWYLAPRAPAL